MADFVGATADEIALTRSTSEGMNIFIRGLDWKAGDEVVYCTHEHGGGIQPLQHVEARYGVKLDQDRRCRRRPRASIRSSRSTSGR